MGQLLAAVTILSWDLGPRDLLGGELATGCRVRWDRRSGGGRCVAVRRLAPVRVKPRTSYYRVYEVYLYYPYAVRLRAEQPRRRARRPADRTPLQLRILIRVNGKSQMTRSL